MVDTSYDETKLIQSALKGNLDAFNGLVLVHQNVAYTIAYRIMGDSESAADVTQEAFITAYRRLDTYRGGSFKAWLGRIVTNLCYDELRRRKRRPATSLDELGAETDDGPAIPSQSATPEQTIQENELQSAIQQCIQGLGEDQRLVLVMSDIEGLSYQEIAENTGVNLGTVKSRLSRARVGVRNCLQAVQELLPAAYRLIGNETVD
jgi:RNA polymerase sigma-70 factor, ECF subfamily